MDVIVILGVLVFFALVVGYVSFCERVVAGNKPATVVEPAGHD